MTEQQNRRRLSSLAQIVPEVVLSLKKNVVVLELVCLDPYDAHVLFDDLHDKFISDRGLKLQLKCCELGGAST